MAKACLNQRPGIWEASILVSPISEKAFWCRSPGTYSLYTYASLFKSSLVKALHRSPPQAQQCPRIRALVPLPRLLLWGWLCMASNARSRRRKTGGARGWCSAGNGPVPVRRIGNCTLSTISPVAFTSSREALISMSANLTKSDKQPCSIQAIRICEIPTLLMSYAPSITSQSHLLLVRVAPTPPSTRAPTVLPCAGAELHAKIISTGTQVSARRSTRRSSTPPPTARSVATLARRRDISRPEGWESNYRSMESGEFAARSVTSKASISAKGLDMRFVPA